MQHGFNSTFGQFLQHFVRDSVVSGRFLLFGVAYGASELRQRQRFVQRCVFINSFIAFEVVSVIGFYIDLVSFEAITIEHALFQYGSGLRRRAFALRCGMLASAAGMIQPVSRSLYVSMLSHTRASVFKSERQFSLKRDQSALSS